MSTSLAEPTLAAPPPAAGLATGGGIVTGTGTRPVHGDLPAARRRRPALNQMVEGSARAVDLLLVVATGILTFAIAAGRFGIPHQSTIAIAIALLLAANVFPMVKLYDPIRLGSLMDQLPRLAAAWSATLGGVLVGTFLLGTAEDLSRLWIVLWFAIGGVALGCSRVVAKLMIERAQRAGDLVRNLLVVGGPGAEAYGHDVARHDRATRHTGRLDVDDLVGPDGLTLSPEGTRRLGRWLIEREVDHVALALPADRADLLPALLRLLRHFPVEVGLVPQLPAAGVPVVGVTTLGGIPSILLLEKPLDGWRWILKSVEDRLLAAGILLFIAPLMLAIAVLVKATSPGPVLFRQKRLGFNQEMIDVLKFRSMYTHACDQPLSSKVAQATKDDPRITPIGRFLRRTSLDELPQLVNVLTGDMSLVGPRPHAVAHDRYYAELIDGYLGRHRVKPGITGWAQVNGFRGETRTTDDMRQRIEFDLAYIDNWSLLFDLRIIARTLLVGFAHSKAY